MPIPSPYCDDYCYLPLYIFCGEQLLAAKLRPANIDGAAGACEEIAPIVVQVRATHGTVKTVTLGPHPTGYRTTASMTGAVRNLG